MSRKLTKAEALYCAEQIEELYEMITEWQFERPAQTEFLWPLDDFRFNASGEILWCTNRVFRRRPGRLRRYHMVKEISPMAVTGVTGRTLHVTLRGTSLPKEWDINADLQPVPLTLHGQDFGWVHDGFCDAYETMIEALKKSIEGLLAANEIDRLIVSGHSLGGAVATLIFADLAYGDLIPSGVDKLCCTFGAPRVGSEAFRSKIESGDVEIVRFENIGDIVPTMPPQYPHVGALIALLFDTGSALGNHAMTSYIAGVTEGTELGLG